MSYANKAVRALRNRGYDVERYLRFQIADTHEFDRDKQSFDFKDVFIKVKRDSVQISNDPRKVFKKVGEVHIKARLSGEGLSGYTSGGRVRIFPNGYIEAIGESTAEMLKVLIDCGYKLRKKIDC